MDEETKKKINKDFQTGVSPFVLAHRYNTEINTIYEIIGQPEMNRVVFVGDQIDPSELLPGTTTEPYHVFNVKHSKN